MSVLLLLAVCFLAYSNGANDNFKGVATLLGSGVTDYRKALLYATITTLAGSLCSLLIATSLTQTFSGKGIVSDEMTRVPEFLLAVAGAAALTVMIATHFGFPISTTHALIGGLCGAGLAGSGEVHWATLGKIVALPLALSPVVALSTGWLLYKIAHALRVRMGVTDNTCVCAGTAPQAVGVENGVAVAENAAVLKVADEAVCQRTYVGTVLGFSVQRGVDTLHYFSAGLVGFSRGMNDAPKIVALVLATAVLPGWMSLVTVALAMAVGALLNAKNVAETMSRKITPMNHGQGFTANVVTSALVLTATCGGLPVSTTHCSVGSLFGIGLVTGKADVRVIRNILLSWLLTLPCAAALGAGLMLVLPR